MATASYRARRRTRLPRRRKQAARKKARRRKLLPRRRKQPSKRGRQECACRQIVSPKKSHRHPCDEFVSKVLRRLHRDRIQISTKAKGKMISFIRRFFNSLSDKAKCIKQARSTSTIGSKELQKALKRVMRKEQAAELLKTIQKVSRRR